MWRRIVQTCVLSVAVCTALASGLVAPPPAQAAITDCPSPDLLDGDNLRTVRCDSWRQSYVVNPGQFRLMDYQDLWRYHAMYNGFGFANNWLWYSFRQQHTFRAGPDSGVRWAICGIPRVHELPAANDGRETGLCTDRIVPHASALLDAFAASAVTLDTFGFADHAFVSRACGNFSEPPAINPVPTISGTKYHDRNRNGVRDAGDEGLGGWTVRLHRDSSDLVPGQPAGFTGLTTTTAADGSYSFPLWEQGPGTYRVEEAGPAGYVQTAAPAPVHVGFGAGSHTFGGNDLGNVEDSADVVKLDWQVVSAPETVHAREPVTLAVRATVTNAGPAPEVHVVDTMRAAGPDDCSVTPAEQSAERDLVQGQPQEIAFTVTVVCADPSFHSFVFDNQVRTTTGGVNDPDAGNNARSTGVTIAVIDDAALRVAVPALDCPDRTDVDSAFTCTGTVGVHNDGPYGPANADVTLALALPADCTSSPAPVQLVEDLAVPVPGPVVVSRSWDVTCADRSYHPIGLTTTVALDHLHVRDLEPADDSAAASDTVEVFEPADLAVVRPVRIACGGRLPSIASFDCTVRVTVRNNGPATAVHEATTVSLSAPADCTVTPTPQTAYAVLDAGGATTHAFSFTVQCTARVLHTLLATAVVTTDEPHAEDRAPANNTGRVRWVPTDVKPGSEPSSVNLGKEGVVPVSILSTPTFDARAEVVQSSLRYGATGFEPSLVSCGTKPEYTNADGLVDLVCRFATPLTGFTCATTVGILTGLLADGTPFESQDPVKITGCNH